VLLNTVFEANWKYIKDNKQKLNNANNVQENACHIPHEFHIGDKVLLKNCMETKMGKLFNHVWIVFNKGLCFCFIKFVKNWPTYNNLCTFFK
jgi:hypothetical protein